MAGIELDGVLPADVWSVWPDVAILLQKAIDRGNGEHTTQTILDALLKAKMQLWIGTDKHKIVYAGVTQVITYATGKKIAEICYLGGSRLDEWLDHIHVIEAWAKANGCACLNIIGREGWMRKMDGYKRLQTIISRKL